MSKPDITIETTDGGEKKRLSIFEASDDRNIHESLICKKRNNCNDAEGGSDSNCEDPKFLYPAYSEQQISRGIRSSKLCCDWTENAIRGEHLWCKIGSSSEPCYVSEMECCLKKSECKIRCSACRICVHSSCIEQIEKINFKCKPTFRESMCAKQAEHQFRHHWVHRRRQEGRCKQCGKTFQQKFPFGNKEVIAISCSWCKTAYHNKINCFMMQQINETCSLGIHANIIVPPAWILKVPKRKISSSSSFKRGSIHRMSSKRRRSHRISSGPFVIKAPSSSHIHPILVFINPKSGGNQGAKLIQEFHWLLNPRQIFDLSICGPTIALEFYKKLPNFRILICGGDGTVCWVLSAIDHAEISPFPPCSILPLGTGNDLARSLNWGSGYADEPLSKILQAVEEGKVLNMDRWNVWVEMDIGPDGCSNAGDDDIEGAVTDLPINVFNNYFSLGADAAAAMEFHESREAKPEKFNNRLKNKIFYAGVGGKDLLKRSWKDLCEYIILTCDDIDMTQKVKDLKLHCLLFLNIPRYSAGTNPWGNPAFSMDYSPQSIDDGLLEVIGFTSTSLATIQVGGHGERICQCRKAQLTTLKTIPVQVDGEPCRLKPSIINISHRNTAKVILKMKRRGSLTLINEDSCIFNCSNSEIFMERLRLQVSVISITDYEDLLFEKERLKQSSTPLGIIVVDNDADLACVRSNVNRLAQDTDIVTPIGNTRLSDDWIFLDSTTTERFFRIDRSQESMHFVTDISSEDIYILDNKLRNAPPLPELLIQHLINEGISKESQQAVITEAFLQRRCSCNVPVDSNSTSLIPPSMEKRLQQRRNSYMDMLNKAFIDACKRGNLDKAKQLLEDGADLYQIDVNGMTCLHHAVRFGYLDIVKLILDNCPSSLVNIKDIEKGQTALHKAAWYRRKSVCQLLVEYGASILSVDNNGDTAISLCRKSDDSELEMFLSAAEMNRRNAVFEAIDS